MAKGMEENSVRKGPWRKALRQFLLTLMGGRRQRWDTIRKLSTTDAERQKRG